MKLIPCAALLFGLIAARADAGCWAPDFNQSALPGAGVPALWQNDFAAIRAMMKALPSLLRLDDARQRVNTFIGLSAVPGGGNLATIRGTLYPRNTWVGECALMASPEFFNSGALFVGFNQLSDIWTSRAVAVRDDVLTAYLEPQITERIQDEALYDGRLVILTPDQLTPWIDVSVDEFLAYKMREFDRAVADAEQQLTKVRENTLDRAAGDRSVESMRKTDPQAAEQLRQLLDRTARDFEENRRTAIAEGENTLERARRDRTAFQTSTGGLTPEQRRAPARLANGANVLAAEGQTGRGKLVKINPSLSDATRVKRRVHLIVVTFTANDPKFTNALRQAIRELDLPRLRRMLQP